MSIMIPPTTIRMTEGFKAHFCNETPLPRGANDGFGEKIDRQLVDVYGSYRSLFIDGCFAVAPEMVEDYQTGYWRVAELNNDKGFFIFPADRGSNLFRITMRDSNNKPTRQYDVDDKTLGLIATVLSFDKCIIAAQDAQKQVALVVSHGGESTVHDAEAAMVFRLKKSALVNMLVSTVEAVNGTATEADALANIALRELVLSYAD